MRIVFVTVDYPDERRTTFSFVKALVEALAERGNECAVIAPYSVTHNRHIHRIVTPEATKTGAIITVIRPPYLSLSKIRIGGVRLTDKLHAWAVKRGLSYLRFKPDVVYGHFWSSAYEGYEYCKLNNIPLFVATGESVIADMFSFDQSVKSFCDYVKGVICVSSKNKEESISLGLTTPEKCIVIPNATNSSVFVRMDKEECRNKLGIHLGEFVVAFVGWFNNRKGVLRVSEGIKSLKDEEIKSIFIGGGEMDPDCEGILFKGSVAHNDIPIYLNAADVFVLPTLQEGCCNAIVEALSCGLPIISSDRSFNWDILDETNSIMVDPKDIGQIANAIERIKNDSNLRKRLTEGALEKAKDLSISIRAEKIESFIKNMCNV